MTTYEPTFPLTRRLRKLLNPTDSVLKSVDQHHGRRSTLCRGAEFCQEGELNQKTAVITSGWMLRTNLLSDGRRHILGVLIPGDLINFSLYTCVPSFSDLECVNDVEIAELGSLRQHAMFDRVKDEITDAMWLLIALDEAIAVNAIARLTRQSAEERVAHLMLDLHYRLTLIGACVDNRFSMPLTQQALGETLGLSVVHVNRVLMQLKRKELLFLNRKEVYIPDPAKLKRLVLHSSPSIGVQDHIVPALREPAHA